MKSGLPRTNPASGRVGRPRPHKLRLNSNGVACFASLLHSGTLNCSARPSVQTFTCLKLTKRQCLCNGIGKMSNTDDNKQDMDVV